MSTDAVSVLVSAAGVLISALVSLFISGSAWGRIRTDVDHLKAAYPDLASKEQVSGLSRDVAEIKGMFRVSLKPDHGGLG